MTFIKLGTDIATNNAVYLAQAARREQTYIIGTTGMGKSSLMLSMVLQNIIQGIGVAVLDPKGTFS